MKTVLFACVHNAGRSQMAAAWFNRMVDPSQAQAFSAGTQPAHRVHPQVVEAMSEVGIDLNGALPQRLTEDLVRRVDVLVTMGCEESCPVVPGVKLVEWQVADPKNQPLESVRTIREDLRHLVTRLIDGEGLRRPGRAPVACTLSQEELRERRGELLPGLAQQASGRQLVEHGVRLRFAPAPGIVGTIARVVDSERLCCAFLRFEISVEPDGGAVTLTVSGPPEAQPLLAELIVTS